MYWLLYLCGGLQELALCASGASQLDKGDNHRTRQIPQPSCGPPTISLLPLCRANLRISLSGECHKQEEMGWYRDSRYGGVLGARLLPVVPRNLSV